MLWFIGSIKNKTAFLLCVFLFLFSVNVYADNVYKPVTAVIPVSFSLSGSGAATFEALIETKDNSPQPSETSLAVYGSGSGEFNIQLTEPGTYKYVVYQKKGSSDKITYDTTVYDVTVFAVSSPSADNMLDYAITAVASDTGRKPDEIQFSNETRRQIGGGGGGGGGSSSSSNPPSEIITINPPDTDIPGTDTPESGTPDTPDTPGTDTPNPDTPDINPPEGDNSTDPEDSTEEQGRDWNDSSDSGNGNATPEDTNYTDKIKNTETATETVSSDNSVDTGDSSKQELAVSLMVISLAAIVLSAAAERKSRNKRKIH